jgi:hypothetical protein
MRGDSDALPGDAATPYRARNVGNSVGNDFLPIFFYRIFKSLECEFYSNSGSQIFQ